MGRLTLVTGASSGIGAAFARLYGAKGDDLVLTARRKERLDALANELRLANDIKVLVVPADLGRPGAVDAILSAVAAEGATIDVLVNNAGYGLPGAWLATTWDEQAAALQVMLSAPLELTHKLLSGMVARKWGRILNVASLAGFIPGAAGRTTYGALKAAMIKFSQALHEETLGTGVHVTAVCPGLTHSEFHEAAGSTAEFAQVPERFWQSADEVAEAGYEASERNRAVTVSGAANKLLAGLAKVAPDPLAMEIIRAAQQRYGGPER